MKVTLMHQDLEIAELELNKTSSYADGLVTAARMITPEFLPFNIKYAADEYKLAEISRWIRSRIIPQYRSNLKFMQKYLDGTTLDWALSAHLATLHDGYWIRFEHDTSTWAKIAFFNRKFDDSVGNLTFGITTSPFSPDSPDLTTGGMMPKTWRAKHHQTYLIKYGTAPDYLEPYNEKIASDILTRICPIPFVKYDLITVMGYTCSICENFLNPNLELITAASLANTLERPSYIPMQVHLRERCQHFKIPNYKQFFDYLNLIDYLIDNRDRNLSNFGFLYDTRQMIFLGPAPIYDNGTSLWNADFPKIPELPPSKEKQVSKELIHHVSKHFTPKLHNIRDLDQVVMNTYAPLNIPEEQALKIIQNVNTRMSYIEQEMVRKQNKLRAEVEH